MKLLHLTPKKNWLSIQNKGLLPSKPLLDHHLEAFKEGGLIGDKVVYFWDPLQSTNTDKMVKDFIYCKHFILPRNKMLIDWENGKGEEPDFVKLGSRLFGEEEDWVLLETELNEKDLLDEEYIHSQTSNGNKENSCAFMNSLYEHDDKILRIGHDVINRSKFKLVGEISTRFYSNDTIGISYKKIK